MPRNRFDLVIYIRADNDHLPGDRHPVIGLLKSVILITKVITIGFDLLQIISILGVKIILTLGQQHLAQSIRILRDNVEFCRLQQQHFAIDIAT